MEKIIVCISGIGMFLIIILLVSAFKDNEPISQEAAGAIKKQLSDLAGRKMQISGDVVDEKGNPIPNVTVKIEKTKITDIFPQLSGVDEKDDKVVESKFALEFPGWNYVYLTFSKKGYYSVKQDLVADSEEGEKGHVKNNIKIVMRKIGEVDEGLKEGKIKLLIEHLDGQVITKGWHPEKHNSDETEDVEFKEPSEVEFYIENDKDSPDSIILNANGKGGFCLFKGNAQNLTYLPLAPEDGYVSKLKLPIKSEAEYYIYFKTDSGLYGKTATQIHANDDNSLISLRGYYILNPTGSRSLRSTKE